MAKDYKIRRSSRGGMLYRPGIKPLRLLFAVLILAGLCYLGFVIYTPIKDAILGLQSEPGETGQPDPPPVITEPQPDENTAPEEVSEQAPEKKFRAVYMPVSVMLSEVEKTRFLDKLPQDINAIMIDIKDSDGYVLFDTSVKEATDWGTVSAQAIDLIALQEELSGRGISIIARMGVFGDIMASAMNKDLAIQYRSPGTAWIDDFAENGGKRWLNPYNETVRKYLIAIAADAAQKGAELIVLNDFRFPDNSLTSDAYFGDIGNTSRAACLKTFADSAESAVKSAGGRLCVYMPVSSLAAPHQTLFGGEAANILPGTVMPGALPYQYGESFDTGGLAISEPKANPADTVRKSLEFAQSVINSELIPLIQGGNEPGETANITAGQIQEQTKELSALGIEEYVLYCSDAGNYLF